MVQDIEPHQLNNMYQTIKPEREDYILCFADNTLYIETDEKEIFKFPSFKEIQDKIFAFYEREKKASVPEDFIGQMTSCFPYLFSIDDRKYFLLREQLLARILGQEPVGVQTKKAQETRQSWLRQCLPEEGRWRFVHTRDYRYLEPLVSVFAGGIGEHLHRWYETHIYCGSCAAVMDSSKKERALVCPKCGMIEYPRISPAVIIAITDGDRILMTKYAPGHGGYRKYALVAGYVEIGETLEDTVRREVMEEVGLRIKNIRYYKSQPWPFDGGVLAGFFVEVDGSSEVKLEEQELSEATWFSRDKMPPVEVRLSLTNEMIDVFRQGKNI